MSKQRDDLARLLAHRPKSLTAMGIIDRFKSKATSKQDDRGIALVAVALVEQLLEDAILMRCLRKFDRQPDRNKLFRGDAGGAINSLAGKITLGHALGLYGQKFREDLDRFRRIRNAFAHAKGPVHFETRSIKGAVSFHMFAPSSTFSVLARRKSTRAKFLEAIGISMIFLYTIRRWNIRYRPRFKPHQAFFYL